jgi:hypothetical protein
MLMDCELEQREGRYVCRNGCGFSYHKPIRHTCTKPPARGLGDIIERTLTRFGIRKRKGCGCSKRQVWLNKAVPFKQPTLTDLASEQDAVD